MNESAKKILELIGGTENINSFTHCATRLRFDLKDLSKADQEGIKSIKEVLAVVVSGGIFQVVIGPKVDAMYQAMQTVIAQEQEKKVTEVSVEHASQDENNKVYEKGHFSAEKVKNAVLNYISGSITPNMPVMVASGLISAILAILTQTGLLNTEGDTYVVWSAIANAAFYFLPALIAVSAAKKLNASHCK